MSGSEKVFKNFFVIFFIKKDHFVTIVGTIGTTKGKAYRGRIAQIIYNQNTNKVSVKTA